jgi:hypothetical protein
MHQFFAVKFGKPKSTNIKYPIGTISNIQPSIPYSVLQYRIGQTEQQKTEQAGQLQLLSEVNHEH